MRESLQGVFYRPETSCATADKESERRPVRDSHRLQRPSIEARAKEKKINKIKNPNRIELNEWRDDCYGPLRKKGDFARGEAMANDDPL